MIYKSCETEWTISFHMLSHQLPSSHHQPNNKLTPLTKKYHTGIHQTLQTTLTHSIRTLINLWQSIISTLRQKRQIRTEKRKFLQLRASMKSMKITLDQNKNKPSPHTNRIIVRTRKKRMICLQMLFSNAMSPIMKKTFQTLLTNLISRYDLLCITRQN